MRVLSNFADVRARHPPARCLITDPTSLMPIPREPPFKLVLCNLPPLVTMEGIVKWLVLNVGKTCLQNVELPLEGTAGFAVVEFNSVSTLIRGLEECCYAVYEERILWASLYGSQRLNPEGRCVLADYVDSRRGFY